MVDGAVNFSVYSRDATGMQRLLFDHEDDAKPARVVQIDAVTKRTYHYWHVFVPGVKPGQLYGYRAHGPFDPPNGLRFDPTNCSTHNMHSRRCFIRIPDISAAFLVPNDET